MNVNRRMVGVDAIKENCDNDSCLGASGTMINALILWQHKTNNTPARENPLHCPLLLTRGVISASFNLQIGILTPK